MVHKRCFFIDLNEHHLNKREFNESGFNEHGISKHSRYNYIKLPKELSHYIKKVLRICDGSEIQLIGVNPPSPEFQTIFTCVLDKDHCIVKHQESRSISFYVVSDIAIALCKNVTNDTIIDSATQLGVNSISIYAAEKSISKIKDRDDLQNRLNRWEKISLNSAQQSDRITVPKIFYYKSLSSYLNYCNNFADTIVWCSLTKEAKSINELSVTNRTFRVLVGPEGDFSPSEVDQLKNFIPLSLGDQRLKVETASTVAISMLQACKKIQDNLTGIA
jgi:16S rRNA (uracil1498-N3)-methyltransferase